MQDPRGIDKRCKPWQMLRTATYADRRCTRERMV